MKTNNKKRLLMTDEAPKNKQITDTEAKIRAYSEALSITLQYVTVNDFEAFEKGFVSHFIQQFKDQLSSQFPAVMKLKAQIESTGADMVRLQQLESQFDSLKGDFNRDTLEPILSDHGIYAESAEQLKRLSEAEAFVKACNKLRKVTEINGGVLSQATKGAVIIDWSDMSLIPNPNWILGQEGQPYDINRP